MSKKVWNYIYLGSRLAMIGILWFAMWQVYFIELAMPSILIVLIKFGMTTTIFGLIYTWWVKDIKEAGKNRHIAITLIVLGSGLNAMVMTLNNGYMPVDPNLYAIAPNPAPCYISGGKLLPLGDVINGASVGDILMLIGVSLMMAVLTNFKVVNPIKKWAMPKFRAIRAKIGCF